MLQPSKTKSPCGKSNSEKLQLLLSSSLKSKGLGVSWKVCSCTRKKCRKNCPSRVNNSLSLTQRLRTSSLMVSKSSLPLISVTKSTLVVPSIRFRTILKFAKRLLKTSCHPSREHSHVSTSLRQQICLISFQMVATPQRS